MINLKIDPEFQSPVDLMFERLELPKDPQPLRSSTVQS